jgi:hypothetical protein
MKRSCHLSVTTACYNVVDMNGLFIQSFDTILREVGSDSDA